MSAFLQGLGLLGLPVRVHPEHSCSYPIGSVRDHEAYVLSPISELYPSDVRFWVGNHKSHLDSDHYVGKGGENVALFHPELDRCLNDGW